MTWEYNQYLAHFGILGMKWGVRRYQNEDGTLTDEGKKRYSSKDVRSDLQKAAEKNSDLVKRIKEDGPKIEKMADELYDLYDESYKKVKLSAEAKNRVWQKLQRDFGPEGTDDDELYELALDEYLVPEINNALPKSLLKKRDEFDKFQETYWNNVHKITSPIEEKYKDNTVLSDLTSYGTKQHPYSIINDFRYDVLDTSMPSYIYSHFDDYIDEYPALKRIREQFSLSEFNRRLNGNTNQDKMVIQKYKKEHPNTKLNDKEILLTVRG